MTGKRIFYSLMMCAVVGLASLLLLLTQVPTRTAVSTSDDAPVQVEDAVWDKVSENYGRTVENEPTEIPRVIETTPKPEEKVVLYDRDELYKDLLPVQEEVFTQDPFVTNLSFEKDEFGSMLSWHRHHKACCEAPIALYKMNTTTLMYEKIVDDTKTFLKELAEPTKVPYFILGWSTDLRYIMMTRSGYESPGGGSLYVYDTQGTSTGVISVGDTLPDRGEISFEGSTSPGKNKVIGLGFSEYVNEYGNTVSDPSRVYVFDIDTFKITEILSIDVQTESFMDFWGIGASSPFTRWIDDNTVEVVVFDTSRGVSCMDGKCVAPSGTSADAVRIVTIEL